LHGSRSGSTGVRPSSVWETLLLIERGKLALSTDGAVWVRTQLAATPVRLLAKPDGFAVLAAA